MDLRGGVQLASGLLVRAGVTDLSDWDYVHHLSAKNPSTGAQIPELARAWFARVS